MSVIRSQFKYYLLRGLPWHPTQKIALSNHCFLFLTPFSEILFIHLLTCLLSSYRVKALWEQKSFRCCSPLFLVDVRHYLNIIWRFSWINEFQCTWEIKIYQEIEEHLPPTPYTHTHTYLDDRVFLIFLRLLF